MYHTELSRVGPGLLLRDIVKGEEDQILASVSVIRAANADVIVLADVDFDANLVALNAFADQLELYPYRFALPPNRGVQQGFDLDRDGRLGEPEDAHGYGRFVGDGGLAVLSKWPIVAAQVRDLSRLPWSDFPGAIPPDGIPDALRLSTTGHWIVPVKVTSDQILNLMVWHATPPVFDGPEDMNGRRNHDEAALWLNVLNGTSTEITEPFVLAGISNLDPVDGDGDGDGDGRPEALNALLSHPRLKDPRPASVGAVRAATDDGGINLTQSGDPGLDTVDWSDEDNRPGNLRVAYALPSADLTIADAGVLWPADADSPLGQDVRRASRHRLVWVDVCLVPCP